MAQKIDIFKLPSIVTPANKYRRALYMYLFAGVVYLTTNHFPSSDPILLSSVGVDAIMPFMPLTFWVYVSEFLLFFLTIYVCNEELSLNRYYYGFIALQLISALIFLAWPTTFPRGDFPLPANLDYLTRACFGAIRAIDNPHNTTPSLHVSSVYLCSMTFWRSEPRKFALFMAWSTAIAFATMTTKQHYFVDVVTGMGLALLIAFAWSGRIQLRK